MSVKNRVFHHLPAPSVFQNTRTGRQTTYRIRFASDDSGEGAAVLFLHGFNGSSRSWAYQFAHFTNRTVLAVDAPGFGGSDVLDDSMTTTASEVAALIDHCGIDRVMVVGHSMGGMLAQVFGAIYPALCDGLFLSCTHKGRAMQPEAPLGAEIEERLRQRAALDDQAYGELRVRKMLDGQTAADIFAFLTAIAGDIRVAGIRAGGRAMQVLDTTPLLDQIHAPVAILTAERDIVVKPEAAAALSTSLPKAYRFHLAAVGHAPYCEDAAGFNAALEEFLTICQTAKPAT